MEVDVQQIVHIYVYISIHIIITHTYFRLTYNIVSNPIRETLLQTIISVNNVQSFKAIWRELSRYWISRNRAVGTRYALQNITRFMYRGNANLTYNFTTAIAELYGIQQSVYGVFCNIHINRFMYRRNANLTYNFTTAGVAAELYGIQKSTHGVLCSIHINWFVCRGNANLTYSSRTAV